MCRCLCLQGEGGDGSGVYALDHYTQPVDPTPTLALPLKGRELVGR
jgi:hypothetical protein